MTSGYGLAMAKIIGSAAYCAACPHPQYWHRQTKNTSAPARPPPASADGRLEKKFFFRNMARATHDDQSGDVRHPDTFTRHTRSQLIGAGDSSTGQNGVVNLIDQSACIDLERVDQSRAQDDAVPCWSSWKTGISSIACRRRRGKHPV